MTTLPTLCELFQQTCAAHPDLPALVAEGEADVTWSQYADRVGALAAGLQSLGLRPGETVTLLTRNTPDFHIVDTAVMHARGVPFSVHAGDPVTALINLVTVARPRLIISEPGYLETARALVEGAGPDCRLIVLGEDARPAELTIHEVDLRGRAVEQPDEAWRSITADDTATLIFTSGTTGPPKAVQLSHRAITASLRGFESFAPVQPDGRLLSYLPLNHIAERFMTHYTSLAYGAAVNCVADASTLYEDIVRTRPTRFFGVPRVYEKLADRARELISADSALVAAQRTGLEVVRGQQAGEVLDARRQGEADAAFERLGAVRAALGLDRAVYRGVATAPSSYGLLEFFLSIGLPVGDIWGLSEAIMCTSNPPDAIRLGTVGRFLAGVEGRIAVTGELCVRGPNTFSGYLHQPEKTAEILDADGWIHTGDLGKIEDGYLSIIGRMKEIMITAGGHNLSPAAIEGAVKDASPLIDHVIAIADGQRYVSALIALDRSQLESFAARSGLIGGFEALARAEAVRAEVERAVEEANTRLSRPETVRRWQLVEQEWLPGGDEVTPTMKLRRAEIARKYSVQIAELYRS